MSGPKIDYAELERQRKAELERQRQERLRRIREATDKLNREISRTEVQLDYVNKHLLSETQDIENAPGMTLIIKRLM